MLGKYIVNGQMEQRFIDLLVCKFTITTKKRSNFAVSFTVSSPNNRFNALILVNMVAKYFAKT